MYNQKLDVRETLVKVNLTFFTEFQRDSHRLLGVALKLDKSDPCDVGRPTARGGPQRRHGVRLPVVPAEFVLVVHLHPGRMGRVIQNGIWSHRAACHKAVGVEGVVAGHRWVAGCWSATKDGGGPHRCQGCRGEGRRRDADRIFPVHLVGDNVMTL